MLEENQIDIWMVRPKEVKDRKLLDTYLRLMSEEEHVRHQRFIFERHRHAFLVTRALVRSTLSKYADILPEEWIFSKNQYGRPEIAEPILPFSLRFNISHADDVIVCMVNRSFQAGIDVENTERVKDPLQLSEHFFSSMEDRHLKALPTARQRQRFFSYWTLKEAYIKAKGMGLAIPLDRFSFQLETSGQIDISFDERLKDTPSLWRFGLWQLDASHLMAVATPRTEPMCKKCNIWETVPLTDMKEKRVFECLAESSESHGSHSFDQDQQDDKQQ